jgi:hypothetical protein
MGKICHTGSHVVRLIFGLLLTESTLIILFPAPEFLKKKSAERGQGRQKKDNYERRRGKKGVKKKWEKEGRPRPYLYLAFPPTPPILPSLNPPSMPFLVNSSIVPVQTLAIKV